MSSCIKLALLCVRFGGGLLNHASASSGFASYSLSFRSGTIEPVWRFTQLAF